MLTVRLQLLLIIAVTLGIFSFSAFAGFCNIDDVEMVRNYQRMAGWTFKGIFAPSVSGGLYYRPLIGVSFLVDKYAFGLNPALMHLHNVLLHLANTILVYLLTRETISEEGESTLIPFIAALGFCLHPVNTESVNWVSGRTDLLAAFFILASTLLLLRFKFSHSPLLFVLSAISFLMGMLVKEVSIAFLPGVIVLLASRGTEERKGQRLSSRRKLWRVIFFILAATGAVAAFLYLRSLAFTSNYGRIGMTLKFMFTDPLHTLFVFLRAFGFYMKKLFFPWPLNFAILEVDPLYELLAIPIVLLCLYIALRRTLISALFTMGILLITPSFVIAYNQIAWTPYAERYVYLSSAFIIISVLVYLKRHLRFPNLAVQRVTVTAVIGAMAISTGMRNLTWQTNLGLCRDTVEKSPESKDMRVLYSALLAEKGDYGNAFSQAMIANSLFSLGYDERPELNMAYIAYQQGRVDKAIRINETIIVKSKHSSTKALENLISIWEEKGVTTTNSLAKKESIRKAINYSLQLHQKNTDPNILYRIGKLYLTIGEKSLAADYFLKAADKMDSRNEFRPFALKLANRCVDRAH